MGGGDGMYSTNNQSCCYTFNIMYMSAHMVSQLHIYIKITVGPFVPEEIDARVYIGF